MTPGAVTAWIDALPPPQRRLVTALRRSVRDIAPEAVEALVTNAISFHHPSAARGVFVQIVVRSAHVRLDFIRGAWLPDPAGLLHTDQARKYKRFVPISSPDAAHRPEVCELIEAAWRVHPSARRI